MPHETGGFLRPSNAQVETLFQAVLITLLCQLVPGSLAAPLGTIPAEPAGGLPVSLERIKGKLAKAPAVPLKADVPMQLRPPTFKARVDQRVFVLTLEEALHKQFDLNDLQRQSAEWSSKCCGVNFGQVEKIISDALKQRQLRKTREQIARELAELEAAAAKIPITVVK